MAGRGPQSFKKRQKEQQRKEKQQEKLAKRRERQQSQASAEFVLWQEDGEALRAGQTLSETSVPPNSLCVNGGDRESRVHGFSPGRQRPSVRFSVSNPASREIH